MREKTYDVIVIGGGHAGIEAALASSRMGCQTLLVSLHLETIALMSCNPAIGGIGKGQLVREIDALGGEMARATDACGIQFKTLNASKGQAVWSSRAQADRKAYSLYMQKVVKRQKNLKTSAAEVVDLVVKDKVIYGIKTADGKEIAAKIVVITPGTFLNGLIHMGKRSFPGGRLEEQDISRRLSDSLRDVGLRLLRFNTCTSARLDGKTIDFSQMQIQPGDASPRPFSLSTKRLKIKQLPCYLTYTNEKTHSIIRNNLDSSALLGGRIAGPSVRYCPSFEEKIVKFPHHSRHQIFLEPEGLHTDEYYPNGLFTNMSEEVQKQFIRSIPGLQRVKINRFGYGIEHDVVDATQHFPTLESKLIKNLYLAGQINGTTGYEEAASQGLIAGINAALRAKGKKPFILDRSTSYIGVLLDDLTTKGTPEPYRMFTSRVEYRLLLREDNADLRLRKFGYEFGLVNKTDYKKTQEKQKQIQQGLKYLRTHKVRARSGKISLFQLLKRPGVKIEDLKKDLRFKASGHALRGIEIEVKYSGFIQRQLAEVRSFKHLEKIEIPENIDYDRVCGLSREIKEKLIRFKPLTLGQAERISGITPVAIMVLLAYFRKRR